MDGDEAGSPRAASRNSPSRQSRSKASVKAAEVESRSGACRFSRPEGVRRISGIWLYIVLVGLMGAKDGAGRSWRGVFGFGGNVIHWDEEIAALHQGQTPIHENCGHDESQTPQVDQAVSRLLKRIDPGLSWNRGVDHMHGANSIR